MSANSSPRWKNCRGNPLFTVRIERSRDDPRHSAVLTGVSTSLDTNGHGIFDMTDLFSKFDPLIQQRSEEHTSELQSLMRISYAVFCLNKKKNTYYNIH